MYHYLQTHTPHAPQLPSASPKIMASGSDIHHHTTSASAADDTIDAETALPPPLFPTKAHAPHPHRVSFMHRLSSSLLSDSSSSRHCRSRSNSHHGAAAPRSATPISISSSKDKDNEKNPRRPISLRRTSSIFSIKAINDEMDEFERAEEEEAERLASSRAGSSALSHISAITAAEGLEEEEIESGNQQQPKQKQPPPRRASMTDSDSVAFEEGERIGRFFVSKRKGMTIGPIARSTTAEKDATPAPTPTAAAPVALADSHTAPLVVVLFGWLTCQDKHLQKYAQLYHRIGCEVVLRHTVPAGKVLRRKQRGVVRAGAELIAEIPRYFPNAKVVIHVFSNGGCFVYRRLLLLLNGHYDHSPEESKHLTEEQRQLQQQLLQRERTHASYVTCVTKKSTTVGGGGSSHGASTITSSSSSASSSSSSTSSFIYKFPQLQGVIFDSCPAAADAVTAARAMSAALRGPIARFVMFSTIYSGLQVYGAAQAWQFEKKWLRDMEEDPLPVPSLYIYSEDDQITDPAMVENVMDARKETLTAAASLKAAEGIEGWKVPTPSAHVCHYAKYPEEYKRRIKDFLVNKGLMAQQHGQQS